MCLLMQEMQEMQFNPQVLLEEDMATHPSMPAWRILWTEEPPDYSLWGHKESDRTEWALTVDDINGWGFGETLSLDEVMRAVPPWWD